MNPRYYPEIDDRLIIRHAGKLRGKITPGEVFAWEPDKPWCRMLCIVNFISKNGDGENMIHSVDMDYQRPCVNSEDRFREACSRTVYQLFPTEKPKFGVSVISLGTSYTSEPAGLPIMYKVTKEKP